MLSALLAIAGVHVIALASPGPDIFLVMQTAAKRSRKEAFACILGIVLGVAFWATLSILGLQWLFDRFVWLHRVIMGLGGLYLLWMGVRILRSCFKTADPNAGEETALAASCFKAFTTGLLTNLANAKAIIYFSSIFSMFIAPEMSSADAVLIFCLIITETFLFFSLVALLLGLPRPKAVYRSLNKWIDGVCGIAFCGFGSALVYAAFKP